MEILEKGHIYELAYIDGEDEYESDNRLVFVNREEGTEHSGTQTQDVIRCLIDRTRHCDSCLRWEGNDLIIQHLRMALVLHEMRALERKVERGSITAEDIVLGDDGHYRLAQHERKKSEGE